MQDSTNRVQKLARATRHKLNHMHRHPAGWPLLLFVGLVLLGSAGMYVGLNKHVPQLTVRPNQNFIAIVRIDGVKQTVPTNADTVGQLLAKLNVKLAKNDRVEPDKSAPITGDNFLVNVYRATPVTIIDGDKQVTSLSAAATARSLAEQAGVQIYPEDTVRADMSDNIVVGSLGHRVVIDRATVVNVSLYSNPAVAMRTQAETVGELVKNAKIIVTKDDTVKPAPETKLTPGMQIAVVRNGIQTVAIEETIAAPVRTLIDTSLSFGSQAVRQEGSPGKRVQTYEINIQHGEEVSRRLVQSVVTVQPVEKIVAKGNTVNIPADKQAVMAAAGISPSDYAYVDYIFSRESHWNAAAVSSNGYYGLGQTNLAKLSSACPNWQSDPVCQTQLFTGYAGRYGGWAGSYNFWLGHGWW